MAYQVVFVKPSAGKKTPTLVFPFILEENASYAYFLTEIAVVANNDIFQPVIIVYSSFSNEWIYCAPKTCVKSCVVPYAFWAASLSSGEPSPIPP